MAGSIAVVVNTSGGTAASLGDKLEQTMRAAFARQDIDLHLVRGEELAETIERCAAAPLVAVGGGDGTQGSAAALLHGRSAQLVLPLGTRNHLARQLGMPEDLQAAAQVAASGRRTAIDLACAGERVFVNNASIGLYTRLVRERDRRPGPKWLGTIPATWTVLRTLRARPLRLVIDEVPQTVVTPLLFVGNNRYSLEAGSVGERASLSDGVLSVFAVRQKTALGLIGMALRALFGRADPQRDFCEIAEARELTIEGAGTIEVAFDGEVERMNLPLRFRIMPAALDVLVPPES